MALPPSPMSSSRSSGELRATARERLRRGDRVVQRQPKGEPRAGPYRALHREITSHGAGELAADRQAEAGASSGARESRLLLREWLEDRLELLCWNAATG